ncbi:MAG: hypothetical protein IIB28_09595 [Chloroflexi bacterium]|nr:hypothetical protein [Chloroflexota bacterium]
MGNWMGALALHYDAVRRRYPDETLMILFDIDGTIVDMRYLIMRVLQDYDLEHGTGYFQSLDVAGITVHENDVGTLLDEIKVPSETQPAVLKWWADRRWGTRAMMEYHTPMDGVFEIIRWLDMQPGLVIGLNTGRPEFLRADTLRSLNRIGEECGVHFESELLHMNPGGWEDGVPASKVDGVRKFQREGYRVIAMVDNEPANLAAVHEMAGCEEILPLHAHTIFESECGELPACSPSGSHYVLADLAREEDLPENIQFVWHGINDDANLRQFVASDVEWGEVDVRTDPHTGTPVLGHDELAPHDASEDGRFLTLDVAVERLNRFEKSIKFDFKEGGALVDRVVEIVNGEGIGADRVWFNGTVEILDNAGFRKLRKTFPAAIIQTPIDSLAEQIMSEPAATLAELQRLRATGVNRFSIEWAVPGVAEVVKRIGEWGFDVNIYNVPDLDGFLRAVLLKPRSITADFNFPTWHYYGRGSGKGGRYYEYTADETRESA